TPSPRSCAPLKPATFSTEKIVKQAPLAANAPLILCVTGPMASGKNAVSAILEKHGFVATDADKLVHQALADSAFQKKVIETFAPYAARKNISLTNEDGSLNRRNLGALIFKDKKLLAMQESMVHPVVNQLIEDFIAAHPNQDIVLNATVLYKIPAIKRCNAILFVTAPIFTRFFRAKHRDNMRTTQIFARFWQQRSLFAKYFKSDADIYRVNNTGNLNALESKINAFLKVCR
ncbi:MAG: dephospho-CoA kinase, partial [Treponema sp.]|nr:dephospho-CoA kinase [Treponema sp.]